jgi:S-adenosylmethionine hydrolase
MASLLRPLITLTTDFGTRDAYVAAMKGVLLSIAPQACLVDITHEIHPQDVLEAAFVLREAVPYFPPGTIHLVVVDPGVGTERRAVALRHGAHRFVGPDNGIFSLVLGTEQPEALVELDRPAFWRTPTPSRTFHGRDIFAPVAGHLATGKALEELGTPRERLSTLRWVEPSANPEGLQGWVVHIDRFGNCITNISRTLFEQYGHGRPFRCYVGSHIFHQIHPTYGAVAQGEALLLFGSSDYLEVAVNGGNAAELLDISRGASVHIVFQKTT